ncbi:MAG: adenylate/guanylate cyclase domain-containing protein, partial [Acidobacteriota bacterium]
ERIRLKEEKRRLEERNSFIKDTFGRYLSDAVVQTLLESPDGLKLGGEKRQVTILMSDLRGFSPLAESLKPEQVVAMLNRYFEVMIDIVVKFGGTIDELIGDSMLVMFGAPLRGENDAQRAVACAVAMQLGLDKVNERNRREGLPTIAMGVGINTGQVVVGNIGSQKRAKYGIVGSHVNLASRIESRTIGGQVLIAESTLQQCESILDVSEPIDFNAKGFEKPIRVREVHGIGGEYNLHLPARNLGLATPSEPVPVRYSVVSQGEFDDAFRTGEIVELSPRGAAIRSDSPPDLAASLKIQIAAEGDETTFKDVYGKVMESATADCFVVSFTSLPPEVRAHFESLLA